jgi:hypothetical protein
MPVTRALAKLTITLFSEAAKANRRNTPCRRGNLVEITSDSASDVMVTADLHGDRLNFERVLEIASLSQQLRRHLVLQEICHGGPTYPNEGGCMSHLLLEDVAQLKIRFPERVHFILSNHELAEATDFPVSKAGQLLNLHFYEGLKEMYGDAVEDVHAAIKFFLLSCPLAARVGGNVFLSHSLPSRWDERLSPLDVFDRDWSSEDLAPGGDVFRMVWGRDYRRKNALAFANTVGASVLVHGHEPCPDGYQAPNDIQVIIDTSGQNACYALLPLDSHLTHADVLGSIRKLHA